MPETSPQSEIGGPEARTAAPYPPPSFDSADPIAPMADIGAYVSIVIARTISRVAGAISLILAIAPVARAFLFAAIFFGALGVLVLIFISSKPLTSWKLVALDSGVFCFALVIAVIKLL